jgi:hypothetical protein
MVILVARSIPVNDGARVAQRALRARNLAATLVHGELTTIDEHTYEIAP